MSAARPEAAKPIRLVAGLGNPGREYENTRHNAGFLVLDNLATRQSLSWSLSKPWQAQTAKAKNGCILVKPLTFMNRSGEAVRAVAQFYKLTAEEVLVVYDDLALPVGQLRLRPGGSSGGQNGMQSVIDHFNTAAVPRLRVGIGSVERERSMVDHVLSNFAREELALVSAALDRAADALELVCRDGLATAMNLFNRAAAPATGPNSAATL